MKSPWLARIAMGQPLTTVPSRRWPQVIDEARWEGLTGLLHAVAYLEGTALPAPGATAMAAEHLDLAAANLAHLGALGEILREADGVGVEILVLPGASLIDLYPDLGCRPMDDVDVLVRTCDEDPLGEMLRRLGFHQSRGHDDLFVRGSCILDVHTDLVNAARVRSRRLAAWMEVEAVWRRRRVWDLGDGQQALALSREDELLYTAVHSLRHSYRRLSWFCDLCRLARQPLDWGLVGDLARQGNIERPLAYGLRYLVQEGGVTLPEAASQTWGAPDLPWLEERLLARLLRERPLVELGEVLWSFSCRGWVARLRFLAEFLFPRPQVLRQVFPGVPVALMPLAYVLRLGQVCRRGGAALIGMAKG